MKMDKGGSMTKLAIIGIGALFAYSKFGGTGLIVLGIVVLIMN